MINTIKQLTALNGISGREDTVREYICKKLDGKCNYTIDPIGNILVQVKGKQIPDKKIMVSAHMDEVGLICTDITDDGYLRIAPVGGIDPRVVLGRAITINNIDGVIGTKAVHMQSENERSQSVKFDDMLLDIGALDKADALKYVTPGDAVYFKSEYTEFGDDMISAKALDDRIGCAIILKLIEDKPEYDITAVFCVQEEVGLRGATVAANTVNPDIAFVVEATTAADITGVEKHKQVCKTANGAVVGFMDKSTIYDKKLFDLAFEISKQNNIPCQTKMMIAGGNDAGAIHKSAGGVRTLAISVPSRYIHSHNCVVNKQDIDSVYKMLSGLIANYDKAD